MPTTAPHGDSTSMGLSVLAEFVARQPGMASRLTSQHRDDGTGHCQQCTTGGQSGRHVWPCQLSLAATSGCPLLGLATAALDLVIRCWRTEKASQRDPSGRRPRDLHAAVPSQWLTEAESVNLADVLGVLDLAAAQADTAGINLPMLSGIGVAVVDSYRAIVTTTTPGR